MLFPKEKEAEFMASVVRTRRGFVLLGALGASAASGVLAAACQGPGQSAAPAAPQKLSGTIKVAAFANAGQGYEFTQEAGQKFEQKKDVRVQVEGVTETASGEYLQKLTTMLVADQPPDAFWNSSTNGLALSYGGHGEPIDSYFARDKMKWTDFFPLAKDCVQALGDNVSWALPVATLTYHMWYNRNAFRQAGVTFPDDNWTFENQYFEAARRLTRDGVFGTAVNLGSPIMVQYVYAFGGQVLSDDLKSVALSGPDGQRALQWHFDLSHRHQVAPGPDKLGANIVRREVAMGIVGAPIIVRDLRQNWEADDIGLALLPKGPKGRFSYGDTRNFAISKASKKKDEAWAFIQSLLEPDNQRSMADTMLWTPVMRSSLQVPDWSFGPKGAPPSNIKDLLRQLDFARMWPRPAEPELRTLFQNEYTKAFRGEQSLQAALTNFKSQGEVRLQEWWTARRK
jgi:multiple sugar transport system substrate-binding protein